MADHMPPTHPLPHANIATADGHLVSPFPHLQQQKLDYMSIVFPLLSIPPSLCFYFTVAQPEQLPPASDCLPSAKTVHLLLGP